LDILSIVGLVLALNAILVGAVLKGAGLMALVSSAAFMIVVVGTCAAIFIQTPLEVMRRALRIFPWVMRPPVRDGRLLIAKMVEWSNIARKQGLLGLEMMIDREPDDFVQKALQLVVDGTEPDNISSVMYVDLNMREHADTTAAKVFEGMGIYSPTLGIIGAVLGLMAVPAEPRRPEQARPRDCGRLHRHDLRDWTRQPVLLARGGETQGHHCAPDAVPRNGCRRNALYCARGESPCNRVQASGILTLVILALMSSSP
jgi:hypothetical protein